jgi:hypothetical protein
MSGMPIRFTVRRLLAWTAFIAVVFALIAYIARFSEYDMLSEHVN